MKNLTLKDIFDFMNTEESKKVSIDLIQPIYNSTCKSARKLNISISGDVSKETKEFLQLVESSWYTVKGFNAAYRLKNKNIISVEPLGYDFYTVKNDANEIGVCNQEGGVLWQWSTDENGDEIELLALGALQDLPEFTINQIVESWFNLYNQGYDAGYEDGHEDTQ